MPTNLYYQKGTPGALLFQLKKYYKTQTQKYLSIILLSLRNWLTFAEPNKLGRWFSKMIYRWTDKASTYILKALKRKWLKCILRVWEAKFSKCLFCCYQHVHSTFTLCTNGLSEVNFIFIDWKSRFKQISKFSFLFSMTAQSRFENEFAHYWLCSWHSVTIRLDASQT